MIKDPFARRIAPVNRDEIKNAVDEYLKKGGRVAKLHDSETAAQILAQRERIQKRSNNLERKGGVIGGSFITSNLDAITVKEK